MKNLLIIFAVFTGMFSSANTMTPENWHTNGRRFNSEPRFRETRVIPVAKYEVKNPTFHVVLIPEWHQIVFQNRVFWEKINIRGSKFKGMNLYAPLRIRYNTQPSSVIESLRASFHPQEIIFHERVITILD